MAQQLQMALDYRRQYKQTVLVGSGNKTTTSATFTAVDSTNLNYLTLNCAVGDVVEIIFIGQWYTSTATVRNPCIDIDVDRPVSANERVYEAADSGAWGVTFANSFRHMFNVIARYVITEAGTHGFRPVWKTPGDTMTMANATSGSDDTAIVFSIENKGPVTA